jgi:CDP-paratose 2-epimerase
MRMRDQYVLITGGAGFIGTNVALSHLEQDQPVHLFDNLARPAVERNVNELQSRFPGMVKFTQADVRDRKLIQRAVEGATRIYHLAAQVAVTTSLENPMADLGTNLLGTLNVLEAMREIRSEASLLFTSTNKVYGRLTSIRIHERVARHEPVDDQLAACGISEEQPLEFLSPYGCSKGSADQYVLDYAHSFGLKTCVFRMSCIYGRYQLGSEDQGWVAHFLRQAMKGEPVTIYGDGKQVRDLLFVEDLVQAMHLAHDNMKLVAGQAFNLGGGPNYSTSLLDLLHHIRLLIGSPVATEWGPERLADQRWFVADTSKIRDILSWRPTIDIPSGLRRLFDWYQARPSLIEHAAVQVA